MELNQSVETTDFMASTGHLCQIRSQTEVRRISAKSRSATEMGYDYNLVDRCKFIEKDLPSSGSMIVEIDEWMDR